MRLVAIAFGERYWVGRECERKGWRKARQAKQSLIRKIRPASSAQAAGQVRREIPNWEGRSKGGNRPAGDGCASIPIDVLTLPKLLIQLIDLLRNSFTLWTPACDTLDHEQ